MERFFATYWVLRGDSACRALRVCPELDSARVSAGFAMVVNVGHICGAPIARSGSAIRCCADSGCQWLTTPGHRVLLSAHSHFFVFTGRRRDLAIAELAFWSEMVLFVRERLCLGLQVLPHGHFVWIQILKVQLVGMAGFADCVFCDTGHFGTRNRLRA